MQLAKGGGGVTKHFLSIQQGEVTHASPACDFLLGEIPETTLGGRGGRCQGRVSLDTPGDSSVPQIHL